MEGNKYPQCPFCQKDSVVHCEEDQLLPEMIYEVICGDCGQFCVLRRLLPEQIDSKHPLSKASVEQLDLDAVRAHNQSALSEGKIMIWVDNHSNTVEWDKAIKEIAEKKSLPREYVFRDATLFIKESRNESNG